jgi:hypothetical protein
MVALALVIWLVATLAVAAPVGLVLRRLDSSDPEEVVDPIELQEAMGRHPSQQPKVA